MPEFVAAVAEAWEYVVVSAEVAGVNITVGNIVVASALVYGSVQQRNMARKMAAAQRDAYNASLTDRTVSIVSADNPWAVLYGEPTVGPAYVAMLTSGDRDQYKHLVAVWAAHECDSIRDVLLAGESVGTLDADGWVTGGKWLHGETITETVTVTLDGSGAVTMPNAVQALLGVSVTVGTGQDQTVIPIAATATGSTVQVAPDMVGTWAGQPVDVHYSWGQSTPRLRVRHHLGTADQLADDVLMAAVPTEWTSSDRGRGLCYSVFTFDLNEQEFQGGPPAPTARIRGKKVYDPRLDSTQPGGSGPQRADDPSTWAWNPNNALCTADFVRAEYGKAALTAQVLWDTVTAAANVCDGVLVVDGEDQPRYRCDGLFRTDADPDVTLDQLCQSMAGFATFTGAWHLQAGAYTAPVMALTDADNMGPVEVVPSPAAMEVMNGMRGRFYDPNASDQLTDYPPYLNDAFAADDGGEYFSQLDLPFTATAWRAHNLARIQVERSRGMQLVYPAKLRALKLKPGQRVTLTNATLNLNAAVFRLVTREYQPGGPVRLTLMFDDPSFYDEVDAPEVVLPPTMTNPDPFHVAAVEGLAAECSDDTVLVAGDGTLKPRVLLSYTASADALVTGSGELQIEYRDSADTEWQRAPAAPGNSTQAWLLDVLPTRYYLVQVRWANGIGAYSDWRGVGVLVPKPGLLPATVPDFRIERAYPGGIELRWTASTVPGQRTEVRLNGDAWVDGIQLYSGMSDTLPYMWPADDHYVLRARRVDAWGNVSAADATITFDIVGGVITGDYVTDPEAGYWARSDGSATVWQRSIIDPESGQVTGYEDVTWLVTATLDTNLQVAVDFNARNDRDGTTPLAPTVAADGTAVDHVVKADGSADVSFEWGWAGDEANIDGFEVMLYATGSSGAYTVGTNPAGERVSFVPAYKRAMLAYGLNGSSYLTWAVRAFRVVDPDVDASGVLYSAWVQPTATGEAPYQPAANVAFSGDLTGTISGIPVSNASTWQTATTNFNARNDRLSGTPAAPTTATDGTAVDHVINGNGSADVSFEWAWSGDESTIDGFEVLLYLSTSSGAYTIGSNPAAEQVLAVPAGKRAVLAYGINPQAYETWAVRSYRVVDPDVNAAGVLRSAWVRPGGSGEDPYRAASAVAFTGDLTGTINGIAVSNASTWQTTSTNFNSRNDRLSGTPAAPTTATDGTAVDHAINGNGSADVSFEWAWSGDESTIDGFEVLLYMATSSGAYTIGSNPAAEQVLAVPANKRAILVYGVSPTAYETWAVRAYRAVDPDVNAAGILRSAWVRPGGSGEDPYRPASSVAFTGDVTGTVGGIPAANVNQWSAISGINVVTSQIDPGAVTANFDRDSGAPTFSVAYGGTWNRVLYDPLSYTPSVNCTVDITIRLSCDAGVGWGGGTLAMAGAVPDSVTYTVRDDASPHNPIYAFPAYTGWSDGYAVADTSHFHDWAAYVGAAAQFPPDRAGITLFASLALTAGTTYRIGLVTLTGEDGGTVYEYQMSVVVRKR